MLSNVEILKEIKDGNIVIENFFEDCLKPSSYVLRISDKVYCLTHDLAEIDTKATNTNEFFVSKKIPEEGFLIVPGRFYLLSSIEKISLSSKIAGTLSQLSCYARIGLNTNFGSNHVSSTFGKINTSSITFEIKNEINRPIRIYPGVKFCHLNFFLHESESTLNYEGIYQGLEPIPANFLLKPAK
jgi:dCTP deaminase